MTVRKSAPKPTKRVVSPAATIAVVVVAVAVVGGIVYWALGGGRPTVPQRFFTVDDGQTYFADDATKVPPYPYKGKQAVAAIVFRPATAGKPFVGYLQTFANVGAAAKSGGGIHVAHGADSGLRIKRPRDASAPWVGADDPSFESIRQVTAPDGSADVVSVQPE